jgi:hypothetical protein
LTILRDIKKDLGDTQSISVAATSDFMQGIRNEVALPAQPQTPPTLESAAEIVTNMVGSATPMDEESKVLMQELVKRMVAQAGETTE